MNSAAKKSYVPAGAIQGHGGPLRCESRTLDILDGVLIQSDPFPFSF